jgi:4a-hydroxytetrahydrobiopterin dehydratase
MAALTRQQISESVDPLGWRLILGAAVTHVRVPSLAAASDAAAVAVTAAGPDGDGHLGVDLYADRIVLRLHTTTTGSVTSDDLTLARRVTEALAARALHTAPGDGVVVPQTIEIAIDALDIPLIRPFWQAVTGYVDEPSPPDLPDGALLDPLRRGPAIWFQQMDEPRSQRNRIHLDVDVAPELAQSRIGAALEAGGTLLSADAAPAFWVLADAEGNEVCVCTWQGRE